MYVCLHCDGPLIKDHGGTQPLGQCGDIILWSIVKRHDQMDPICYVCVSCASYYLICQGCQYYCNLEGHCGYRRPGKDDYESPGLLDSSSGGKAKFTQMDIPYALGNKDLKSFDVSEWMPTGQYGGALHYWCCNTCESSYMCTDQ